MARTVGAVRFENHRRPRADRQRRLGADFGGALTSRASTSLVMLACSTVRSTRRFAPPMLRTLTALLFVRALRRLASICLKEVIEGRPPVQLPKRASSGPAAMRSATA